MAAHSEHPCDDDDCIAIYGKRAQGTCVYYRREDATAASVKAMRVQNADMSVFAYDKRNASRSGAKVYHCMSLTEFTGELSKLDSSQWCYYEVISPDKPCRVYIDAEADLVENPNFDGAAAHVRIVTEYTAWLAEHVCPRFADPDAVTWIVLDASSPAKWSRHYIAVGECMKSMFHVGATIRRFEQHCINTHGKDSDWFINKKHKLDTDYHRSFIIDVGVYTEYRVYRMIYQRKRDSTRVMLPALEGAQSTIPSSIDVRDLYDTMVQPPHLERTIDDYHSAHVCVESDGTDPTSCTKNAGGYVRVRHASHRRTVEGERTSRHAKCPLALYAFAVRAVSEMFFAHSPVPARVAPYNTAKYYPEEMTIMVCSDEAYCRIKGGAHHGGDGKEQSHSYFCVNISARTVVQRCFATPCVARMDDHFVRDRVTKSLTSELVNALDAILDEPTASGIRTPGYVYTSEMVALLKRGITPRNNAQKRT